MDLDGCRNPQTGALAQWAERIVSLFNSYTEISPSRDGLHIIARLTRELPKGRRKRAEKDWEIAIYDRTSPRFFTVTGQVLPDTPQTIRVLDPDDFYPAFERGELDPSRISADRQPRTGNGNGANGKSKFTRLLAGDWQGLYPSQSEADSALVWFLADACDDDPKRIDQAFRTSGLMRPKWDDLRPKGTYGTETITHVLQEKHKQQALAGPRRCSIMAINKYSDDDLTLFFSSTYAADLRYTPELGSWSRYDNGRRWLEIPTVKVYDLARSVVRTIAAQAPRKQRHSLLSAGTINAIATLARGDSRHLMRCAQWDSEPWLLNTPSGVVDLRTGTVRPGKAEDYMTRMTAVGPGGDCPQWLNFLERITHGDKELQSFMQRYAGYSLTGITTEHKFVFGHGTGANGKGRYCYGLAGIMGDYAISAAPNIFMLASNDRHPTEIADLVGARLVIAAEIKSGSWDEVRLKQFTGGDPLKARRMHQNFFQFLPQFKLFLTGNQRPALRSVDEAIRRRLCLVPFEVTIPEKERDSELDQRLRKEWPGVLRWMIAGCLEWQRQGGLNAPAAVLAASAEYLAQEDAVGRWIEEQCEEVPRFSATAILFARWKDWAERNNEYTGSVRSFSQNLAGRQGLKRDKVNGVRGFTGISVKEEPG